MAFEPGTVLDLYVNVKTSLVAGSGMENLGCKVATQSGEETTFIDALNKINAIAKLKTSVAFQPQESLVLAHHLSEDERCPHYVVRDDGLAYANGFARYPNQVIYGVVPFTGPLGTKINLVISLCSVASLVTFFHSTLLMNIITAHSCICLFPQETIYRRTGLTIQNKVVFQGEVRKKYVEKGYKILQGRKDASALRLFFAGRRSVEAGNVLRIPLQPVAEGLPTRFDDELTRVVYELQYTGSPFSDAKLTCLGLLSMPCTTEEKAPVPENTPTNQELSESVSKLDDEKEDTDVDEKELFTY
ncbi:hypothetical protein ONZ45_g6851 [Pleurotus djamor]|nr:hypothetical protein ONZ45_g6851 [Pleurotus djamor]